MGAERAAAQCDNLSFDADGLALEELSDAHANDRLAIPLDVLGNADARSDGVIVVESLLVKAKGALESRLTGLRVNLTPYTLALGHSIPHIPILEHARRTCK